jgi:hypothetical protein
MSASPIWLLVKSRVDFSDSASKSIVARSFRTCRLERRVFLISCPSPRPRVQRKSLYVWPGQCWPQVPHILVWVKGFLISCPSPRPRLAATTSGRLAGRALGRMRNQLSCLDSATFPAHVVSRQNITLNFFVFCPGPGFDCKIYTLDQQALAQ